jgi:hypothetical protein
MTLKVRIIRKTRQDRTELDQSVPTIIIQMLFSRGGMSYGNYE